MKNEIISEITRKMLPYLDNAQMERLQDVLVHCLWSVQIQPNEENAEPQPTETNEALLNMFISAKRVEGCSNKTLRYYETSLLRLFKEINTHVTHIRTDDLRNYLSDYQEKTDCSKSNIDNIRRIMSSFFTWLEDESYIIKSPVRRIHKIRSTDGQRNLHRRIARNNEGSMRLHSRLGDDRYVSFYGHESWRTCETQYQRY